MDEEIRKFCLKCGIDPNKNILWRAELSEELGAFSVSDVSFVFGKLLFRNSDDRGRITRVVTDELSKMQLMKVKKKVLTDRVEEPSRWQVKSYFAEIKKEYFS